MLCHFVKLDPFLGLLRFDKSVPPLSRFCFQYGELLRTKLERRNKSSRLSMPLLYQSLFCIGAWVELQEFGWVFTWWISGFCFFARQNFLCPCYEG